MKASTLDRAIVKTKDGGVLTIAPGTEDDVPFAEMLAFWEAMWKDTEKFRPPNSVVEEFLIGKRAEVERENREFDA